MRYRKPRCNTGQARPKGRDSCMVAFQKQKNTRPFLTRPVQARPRPARPGQARPGQARPGRPKRRDSCMGAFQKTFIFRPERPRPGQARHGTARPGTARHGQARPGTARHGQRGRSSRSTCTEERTRATYHVLRWCGVAQSSLILCTLQSRSMAVTG